jgi:hypothetical protein
MRSQIGALRHSSEHAAAEAGKARGRDQIGHVLVSNLLGGFALELGLKMFYMTYYKEATRGHNLNKLYSNLPDQIRGDIAVSYSATLKGTPPINYYAFQVASDPPSVPEGVRRENYGSAKTLFSSVSSVFTRARYFFEGLRSEEWLVVSHPIYYMMVMSHVIDVVYDEYDRRGGWA